MKKSGKILTAVLAALLCLLIPASCTKDTAEETSAASRDDLNICITDGFATLDPHHTTMTNEQWMTWQNYEQLYYYWGSDIEYCLATGLTVADDAMSIVYDIAKGIRFSNGEEMRATDVAFSILRAVDSPNGSAISSIEDAVADDEAMTVTVTLNRADAGIVVLLSEVLIVSKSFAEANVNEDGQLGYNCCGTGPYMYASHTPDQSLTLVSNPDYRGGEAPITTVNFLLINDPNTAVTAFKAGETDFSGISSEQWESVKASGQFNTAELVANHVAYISFNTEIAPFNDPLLRQAVSCAVDKQPIIDMAMNGLAVPATSMATPLMFGFFEMDVE